MTPSLLRALARPVARLVRPGGVLVIGLALVLTAVQMVCSRAIWPHADLTGDQLRESWVWFAGVCVALVPMLAVDIYFVVSVGRFDHSETVKYLDQAETWLGWRAPLVRVVTLGLVDPRRIVDAEVAKGMADLGASARSSLWWVSAQIGCRVAFGLTLWLAWAARV